MSCGEYEIKNRAGRIVGTSVVDDAFAGRFRSLRRIGDAPCAGDPATPSLARRAASWLRAEASLLLEGKVSPEVRESRLSLCVICPRLVRDAGDEVGFCGACGCGTRSRARLSAVKSWMPKAKCPLRKW